MVQDEPNWLEIDLVLSIHSRQIQAHGGEAGIRDRALLESALGRPRHLWLYTDPKPDVAALAASYLTSISQNHPFFDGNKRTSAVVCEVFVVLNGHLLEVGSEDWYDLNMRVAVGAIGFEELGTQLRKWIKKS